MAIQIWTFISESTGEEISVEAEGFEEACHLMFSGHGDDSEGYDYKDFSLLEVEPLD